MEAGARWQPFKELCDLTQSFALNKLSSLQPIKALLRKHKPDFLSLLKNQKPNSSDRATVKSKTGIASQLDSKLVDEDFVEEALILSDLFDLNELAAVDLLATGEQQKPNYAGLSRGLVAVMLYWDGRRNLVTALRTLIQCRRGQSWTLDLTDEASSLVMSFTDELVANGMTQQILKILVDMKVEAEMERLSQQRGLGDARHRRQIRDLITEVRQCLADCLFYFAGQSVFPKTDVTAIIDHLREHAETEGDGKLSSTTMALLFTLLYTIRIPVDALAEQDEKLMEDLLAHPLIADKNFMISIHESLVEDRNPWKVPCIRACAQVAWSLTFRGIAQSVLSNSLTPICSDLLEQDENILESALADKAFLFMKESIVASSNFHNEEFYLRRMHEIITDLIVNMPLKIKEMRNHGDEIARIVMLHVVEGEEPPPELRRDFQHLIELITAIYNKDPLNLQLSADYWCHAEPSCLADGSYIGARRLPHKQMLLNKFIRQSGDILPPLLYIPYLRMLAALSTGALSARAAFEMLKTNGMAISGNGETLISWDHFFSSCHRYFDNLRQDHHVFDVTSPFVTPQTSFSAQARIKSPPQAFTMTPQEVEGLRAVMKLVAKIAQYNDIACITLYEDQQWCVCGVLFGLLQCPVPAALKGDILLTLAQLGRLPDIVIGLLQASERSQIIQAPSGSEKAGGLVIELEEIESREEEYPMTRGFLKLLAAMANLQTDRLGDIFHSYLVFVVESIFLRAMTRAYIRSEEKWEVVSSSLLLFNRILAHYQPHPEHFHEEKTMITSQESLRSPPRQYPKLPGFSLLLYIYNEGNFFKIVMQTIDECMLYLSSYVTKEKMETTLVDATEQSLLLLLASLELQDPFSTSLRTSGSSLLISSVGTLLFTINPRTGKADYITTIARFICHNATHPRLSLLSIRILSWLCSSIAHPQVVTVMMNSCSLATRENIIQGFVEILDSRSSESEEELEQSLLYQSQLAIIRLLIQCIDQPSPNFSQLLLGFDAGKQPRYVSLQDPGVLGASRSCLHSALSILSTDDGSQPIAVVITPKLAELSYQLVYKLASNPEMTEPFLRYLRSSYDFLYKHVQCLPFAIDSAINSSLMQQSWLLKTLAIELHVLAAKQQRTNVQRLIQVLFSQPVTTSEFSTSGVNQSVTLSDLPLGETTFHSMSLSTSTKPASNVIAMIRMFDIVELSQIFPPPLTLDQFVPSVVEEGIKSCESSNEHGVVFCDIKMLHQLLESSLNTLGADDITRKRLAGHDMQSILQIAVERNQMRESLHGKLHYITSWKQALEISLISCPHDTLPKAVRRQVLFSILQHVVKSALENDAVQELTSPVAALVLTLVLQIRSSLVATLTASKLEQENEGQPQDIMNNLVSFQVIIRDIVDWLLQSGTNQKIRVHLYASVLHYLQLCQQTKQKTSKPTDYTGLRAVSEDVYSRITRENIRLFKDYGDAIKDLLCRDAFDGHSICRVLAFGCLDSLLQLDNEQQWLQFMIKNGYISHIASSFTEGDSCLQNYLNPSTGPIRAVYIYEQKMVLLCSIVHSPGGARAIIDGQVLPELSKCGFLDMRPNAQLGEDSSTSTGLSRYRQLLFPVLHLCSALLTAMGGPSHHEVCALVLQFVLSHHQSLVSSVLRFESNDIQSLTELKLITGILSQTAGQDFTDASLFPNVPQAVLMEIQAHLLRIQRQMLHLLPQFWLSNDLLANVKSKLGNPDLYEQTNLLMHEIAANILTYCRVIITHSINAESVLLFSPEVGESSSNTSVFPNEPQKPSLNLLIKFLRVMLSRLLSEREVVSQLQYKVENIDTLSSQDLKEILMPHTDVVQLSVPQEQKLASSKLKETIDTKDKLTQCLLFVLETAMYLLWQHMDYYLVHAVAMDTSRESILYPSGSDGRGTSTRKLQASSPWETPDDTMLERQTAASKHLLRSGDVDKLKQELPTCLSDAFLKKLSSAEMKGSFIRPLVRRVQCIKLQLA